MLNKSGAKMDPIGTPDISSQNLWESIAYTIFLFFVYDFEGSYAPVLKLKVTGHKQLLLRLTTHDTHNRIL